jgi:hypothetical protein
LWKFERKIIYRKNSDLSLLYSNRAWLQRFVLPECRNIELVGTDRGSGSEPLPITKAVHLAKHDISIVDAWFKAELQPFEIMQTLVHSADLSTAHRRANYHRIYFSLLQPYMGVILHALDDESLDSQIIEILPILTDVAERSVQSALNSTTIYNCVGTDSHDPYVQTQMPKTKRLVLPNLVCTYHA